MIPNDIRVPIIAVEFDSSRAFQGPSILRYKVLIVGQRLSGGLRPQLVIDKITSYSQALSLYGAGSQLARMFKRFFDANKVSDVYGCSLDDAGAGVQALGTFVIGGSATAPGSFVGYVGGERIPVAVTTLMTASQIGTAFAAAINADTGRQVTASSLSGTVTILAKNDGEAGNDIDLRINYNSGEELPAGITCSVNAMSDGLNNPVLQNVIDILGDEWYNIICAPYYDATNMTAIETELTDRFGPMRMIDGVYVTSRRGSVAGLSSFGSGRNSPHVICLHSQGIPGYSPEVAASTAGQLAKEMQADPAKPLLTVELVNILPPAVVDRFTTTENNSLLYDGISTFYVDNGNKVRMQRIITMYQTNALGAEDIAYLDATTIFTLMYLRYDFRRQIMTKYARAKLADDGVQAGAGQVIMTPKLGKSEAINIFRGWESLGLVENIDQFKNDLVCVRSITDPNRLEWVLPPDLINQFRVGAATIQFLLET
jgi:phage tail sheath gpL-like